MPIYATLVGLINDTKQYFEAEIVTTLTNNKSIIKSLSAEQSNTNKSDKPMTNFNQIRLLLRFCACLYNANIIEISNIASIVQISNKIIINENINSFTKEYICYIIIIILIWCDNSHEIQTEIKHNNKAFNNLNDFINAQNNISNPYAFNNIEINLLYNLWNTYIKSISRPYLEFQHKIDTSKIEQTMNNFSKLENNVIGTCNLLPLWLKFGIPLLLDSGGNNNNNSKDYKIEEYI